MDGRLAQRGRDESRFQLVQEVLRRAADAGFERTRFWEYGYDLTLRSERLVLTSVYPLDQPRRVGYSIPAESSLLSLRPATAGPSGSKLVHVAADALTTLGTQVEPWFTDLEMRCRECIEAEVTFDQHKFGILAADADVLLEPNAAKKEFGHLARELATRLTATLYGRSLPGPGITPRPAAKRRPAGESVANPVDVLRNVTAEVASRVDAASFAAFEYVWDQDVVRKIYHGVAPQFGSPEIEPETYTTLKGDRLKLTGRAWRDEGFRYVLDFDRAAKELPEYVGKGSERWHRQVLGEIRTVMYGVFDLDKRYLLRFINRAGQPELPYLYEVGQLQELLQRYSADVRSAVLDRRFSLLSAATDGLRDASTQNLGGRDLLAVLKPGLEFDGVTSFALFSRYAGLEGVQLVGGYGAMSHLGPAGSWLPLTGDLLLASLLRVEATGSPVDFTLPSNAAAGPVVASIKATDDQARQVLILRADGVDHQVYGVVPLRATGNGKFSPRQAGSKDAVNAVRNYCQLAAAALTARNAQLTAAGARRALGMIAHEVRTPVTLLANEAETAIEHALGVFSGTVTSSSDPDFPVDMEVWQRRIAQRKNQITLITSLSELLAQESVDQTLQMFFQPINLFHLLSEVAQDVEHESSVDPKLRRSDVDVTECRNIPVVSGDPELLRLAMANVVRNAVKYSLPPGGGARSKITVRGQATTSRVTLDIINFGLAIPDSIRPAIFQPFVRGEIHDQRKAIRGMGLGLFLTRRIFEAHGGGATLGESSPVFNDRRRLAANEGYVTRFRLWLSRSLPPGSQQHTWGRLPARVKEL